MMSQPFVLQFAEPVEPALVQPAEYDSALQIMRYHGPVVGGPTGTGTETGTGGHGDTDSDTDFD